MDSTRLFLGLIFGSVGLGYFVYGKKQKKMVPFASGIGLCVLSYVGSSVLLQVLIGVVLIVLPSVLKL